MCETGSEVTVRFVYFDLVWVSFGTFRLCFTVQKLVDLYDFHAKCPLKLL
jgi:hypothetical protein